MARMTLVNKHQQNAIKENDELLKQLQNKTITLEQYNEKIAASEEAAAAKSLTTLETQKTEELNKLKEYEAKLPRRVR